MVNRCRQPPERWASPRSARSAVCMPLGSRSSKVHFGAISNPALHYVAFFLLLLVVTWYAGFA